MSRAIDVLLLEEEVCTEFVRSMSAVPDIRRGVEGVVPDWSTHDVLWHVTYWVGRAAEVLEQARGGPPFPDEPEEGSYYDAQNDAVFALGREMSWVDLMRQHATNRERMRSAVAASTGAVREWMEERAMEEVEHHRVHARQVRDFLERDAAR